MPQSAEVRWCWLGAVLKLGRRHDGGGAGAQHCGLMRSGVKGGGGLRAAGGRVSIGGASQLMCTGLVWSGVRVALMLCLPPTAGLLFRWMLVPILA